MLRYRFIWLALLAMIFLFALTACSGMIRGEPVLPQAVVDAISQESVKHFGNEAPEGSLLVETAKLDTYWGEVIGDDVEKYSDVICFKAEIQYVFNGIEQVTYYQGVVKKPSQKGTPWFVDDVSLEVWNAHSCGGTYLIRVTPTPISEP